jgi:hypothetical protein
MNKLEAAYAKHLDEEGVEWLYERISLVLRHGGKGKKGLRYLPDFFVVREECAGYDGETDSFIEFHEVKGGKKMKGRPKSLVHLKAAAEMFPQFRFFLVEWKGEWAIQEI